MAKPKVKPWNYTLSQDWPENLLSEDLKALFECFDIELESLFTSTLQFTRMISADEIEPEFLDVFLMSRGFKVFKDFPTITLTENQKRKLARLATQLYAQKGTAVGIINAVRLLLGIETTVITQYNVDVWKIGISEMGVDTVFSPDLDETGSRPLYSFDIEVDHTVTEEEAENIRALARYMKPAHTHLIDVIVPAPPPDHWEMGVSEIGVTTDVHDGAG